MRQLSKNEQTEINFDERIRSTPRSAQRCSSMGARPEAAGVESVHGSSNRLSSTLG
jgi:hypothetical protein